MTLPLHTYIDIISWDPSKPFQISFSEALDNGVSYTKGNIITTGTGTDFMTAVVDANGGDSLDQWCVFHFNFSQETNPWLGIFKLIFDCAAHYQGNYVVVGELPATYSMGLARTTGTYDSSIADQVAQRYDLGDAQRHDAGQIICSASFTISDIKKYNNFVFEMYKINSDSIESFDTNKSLGIVGQFENSGGTFAHSETPDPKKVGIHIGYLMPNNVKGTATTLVNVQNDTTLFKNVKWCGEDYQAYSLKDLGLDVDKDVFKRVFLQNFLNKIQNT